MILIKLQNISASYNNEIVLQNVSLTVKEDDFIGIIGPNGGGKTTLLKIILGLKKIDEGKIEYMNNINIGYLPQKNDTDKMFPITVEDVIYSGLLKMINKRSGMSKRKFRLYYHEKCTELLQKMNISDIRRKPFGAISGGQMQKTLLCRSLISQPDLLLLDEPNTYIDKGSEFELFEYLKNNTELKAIMLVSHDIGTISQYVKTFACINKDLYYHNSNIIPEDILEKYNCPVQIVTHSKIRHTILEKH